jgi:hypothetical protein
MFEDPGSDFFDGQVAHIDDVIEWRRDGARAFWHLIAQGDVKNRLGMDSLDGIRQRRSLGQVIRRNASENVHTSDSA